MSGQPRRVRSKHIQCWKTNKQKQQQKDAIYHDSIPHVNFQRKPSKYETTFKQQLLQNNI